MLYFGYANAAVPTCIKKDDGTFELSDDKSTSGCCMHNGALKSFSNNNLTEWSHATNSGYYFLKSDCNVVSNESDSIVATINVTYDTSITSVTDETSNITAGYYLQGNGSTVVKCNNKQSCSVVAAPVKNSVFIQSSLKGGLIQYSSSSYTEIPPNDVKEGYYLNAECCTTDSSQCSNQLIQCNSDKVCTAVSAAADSVYIDVLGENSLIICQDNGGTVSCTSDTPSNTKYYINSNSLENAKKPLIKCESGKCTAESVDDTHTYYENGLEDKKKIIYCKGKCSYIENSNDGDYYVGTNADEVNGLISCNETTCSYSAATTSKGYYLNAGGDNSTKQVIVCDATTGCVTKSVNPGYYINAMTDDARNLIKCTLNECTAFTLDTSIEACKSEETESKVCNGGNALNFYGFNATLYPLNGEKIDEFTYTSIKSFPSVSSEITTLFHVTTYGVERFIANGVIAVDMNNHQLVTDFSKSTIGTDVELFDCSTSSKLCTKRSSCQDKTYMYDAENKKALLCSSGTLKDSSSNSGYYVDSSVNVGSRTPYIIQCESGECTHFAPNVASYFKNAGQDSDTNALIYCNGSSCSTVPVNSGYFVANQQDGIINCSSSTSCEYKAASNIGSSVNYVNAGADKSSKALINCSKKKCTPKIANAGYYFTSLASSLIYCENSSRCSEITPTVNYYYYADTSDNGKNYIINCSKVSTSIVCAKEVADTGSYLTSQSNVLVTCSSSGSCKQVVAKPGYYQSAVKITINSSRDVSDADENGELVSAIAGRDTTTTYNIIECTTTSCELLTAEELSTIPVCEYTADKCYITNAYALSKTAVTSITAGNLCTNADRSVFYFATDTIVVAPSVIAGTTATYVYTTTTTNCLVVDGKHSDLYYTVGNEIYRLDDGAISHFFDVGYYFINIEKNTLVNGSNIDAYNNENVKLYKCNGTACKILDNPDEVTYYADVNKRIVKFNVNSDSYSFAYEKDIVCIFANNKCTPNADLKGREFCITYKGELVLAAQDIKNRETGDCYRASGINNNIYGYNQYLYNMDIYSATVIDDNGYYLISISTNSTVSSKDYKNRLVSSNSIKVYGCHSSTCKVYEPESDVYYYDARAKTILKKDDNTWSAPSTSGYALVSINPDEKYVYKFKAELDEITLLSKAASGYYYTVDNEMYECNENDNECLPITETDYYFTNTGEIYYCIYDSENLEKTECTKQSCYVGQNYFISDNYYRCEAGSFFIPIKSRSCKYDENVIVNFPTILKDEFPTEIKLAIENIEKNNNSTAVAVRSNKKYLSVVPAIFTNCTYNVEETEASYDLVCVNNFVAVNDEDDSVEICSIENLGFVECVEDETNPEKCTPSGAFSRVIFNFFTLAFTVFASLYLVLF